MFNCLAKNAAVTEVSFEDAKKLLLAAREQRVFWDEQTLGIFFLRRHQETVAGCAIATGVLGGTDLVLTMCTCMCVSVCICICMHISTCVYTDR